MPVDVVDLLKEIEVDHEERERSVTEGSGDFLLDNFLKPTAIEKAGKRIGDGQVEQVDIGFFQPLLVGTEDLRTLSNQDLKRVVQRVVQLACVGSEGDCGRDSDTTELPALFAEKNSFISFLHREVPLHVPVLVDNRRYNSPIEEVSRLLCITKSH